MGTHELQNIFDGILHETLTVICCDGTNRLP